MKSLNDYVCTEQQAEELEKLGVIPDSMLHWRISEEAINGSKSHVLWSNPDQGRRLSPRCVEGKRYAAFTSGELEIALVDTDMFLSKRDMADKVIFKYYKLKKKFGEAVARADLLIYLLKNKLITVEEVNRRLSGE
jgi:hypothetical protein